MDRGSEPASGRPRLEEISRRIPAGLGGWRVWAIVVCLVTPVVASGLILLAPRTATNSDNLPDSRWEGPLTFSTGNTWPQPGRDAAHTGYLDGLGLIQGQVNWTVRMGGPVIASPVAGNGLVYAASTDGYFYAMQAHDGQVVWRFALGPKLVNSTPVLAGGLVLVAGDFTWLNALDAATGQRIWRYDVQRTPVGEGEDILAPPAVDPDHELGLVSSGGGLVALDLRSGKRRWQMQITDTTSPNWPGIAAPAVSDGLVYWAPGVGSRLFALDEENGSVRWTFDAGDRLTTAPVIGSQTVYQATWKGYLFALDAATGAQRWERNLHLDRPGEGTESTPALAGDRLYLGSYQGTLYSLDARTGNGVWEFHTGRSILSSPAVADGSVYCSSQDGYLYAVEAMTGAPRWRVELGEMRSSPALLDSGIVVGTVDGEVVQIR